ncbi:MAG TPA: SUMF1/EgtB/PvdO family nonheme iron enzyme [Candidatus Omnitrophota bacterium]|nr:SUMF1/EgtB/PvdO family nonheme iron enzyme [Candidatus Omnitrophota bacterium]
MVRLHDAGATPSHKKLCDLTTSGINPSGTSAGSDAALEIDVPADKKGAFLRQADYGVRPSVATTNVQLTVDYSSCGFSPSDNAYATVFGLEMVFIPEGFFYAGDFDGSSASLDQGSSDADPWYVAGEGAISVTNAASNGYRYVSAGQAGEDATGAVFTIPAAFPKGYESFYMMKYELNEGQWVEFFNSLPSASRANRDLTNASHKNSDLVIKRNTISCSGSPLTCSTSRPYRPVSYLTWMDLAAFLDWAALRPMSELEFEKASRGPVLPISGEFVWATTGITAASAISSGAEDGAESVTTSSANASLNNTTLSGGDTGNGSEYTQGPLRNGIFATSSSVRESAGASYYGVMELSGNLRERVATIGNASGRSFLAAQGDGVLSADSGFEGNATNADWAGIDGVPSRGVTGAAGSGFRGGGWDESSLRLRISDRNDAANVSASAFNNSGGRGVRTHGL